MVALGLTPNRSPTKDQRKPHHQSFIGGSFTGGSFLEGQSLIPSETEEQRAERERKEQRDNFKVMSHEDYE